MEANTMGDQDITIDPWGSAQSTDYGRIIDQFGLTPLNPTTISDRLVFIVAELFLLTATSM